MLPFFLFLFLFLFYFFLFFQKRPLKEIFITCAIFGIVGNIIYSMSYKPWMLILGRFISGIGANVYNCSNMYDMKMKKFK